MPGKPPSCHCPLTEGSFLIPSPRLVTPGKLVKSKTQCAPLRGSQSEGGHVRNHPSIRYPLSTYCVLDNRHTPSIGVVPGELYPVHEPSIKHTQMPKRELWTGPNPGQKIRQVTG